MKAFYPFRDTPASKHEDALARMSLRSLETKVTGISKVFAFGKRREWMGRANSWFAVADVEYADKSMKKKNKWSNVLNKVNMMNHIGEPYIMMNDDFIVLKEIDAYDIPVVFDGSLGSVLDDKRKGQRYCDMVVKSMARINAQRQDPNPLTHTPFPVHYPWLAMKSKAYNSKSGHYDAVSFRMMYVDTLHRKLAPYKRLEMEDPKYYRPKKAHEWVEELTTTDKPFVSFGTDAVDANLIAALNELFPHKSRYEK